MQNRFYNSEIANNEKEFLATMRLIRTSNIGPITFLKLISKHKTPSQAILAAEDILNQKNKKLISEEKILQEIENCQKNNAKIITIFHEDYPALLSYIEDLPIVLTYKGNLNLNEKLVSLVGSRYSSNNSVSLSYKIARDLANNQTTVVSGLARGIDTGAHKGALLAQKNCATIAVIAGGIDNIYPPENEKLYKEIAEKGAVITENEFGMIPKAENFPRRNRIISGLCQVTCVVEAALKSGSLITARFANEQGREVAAIPGSPTDPRSEGTNKLIKHGATLVMSAEDILELIPNFSFQKHRIETSIFKEADEEFLFDEDNLVSAASYSASISKGKILNETNLNNSQFDLLSNLSTSPTNIYDLINIHGISAAEINSKILEHEISGEIIRLPGNKVAKVS